MRATLWTAAVRAAAVSRHASRPSACSSRTSPKEIAISSRRSIGRATFYRSATIGAPCAPPSLPTRGSRVSAPLPVRTQDWHFNKPYLTSVRLQYEAGFHKAHRIYANNSRIPIPTGSISCPHKNQKLFLIHLHHADRDYCEGRQAAKAREFTKRGQVPTEKAFGGGGANFMHTANRTDAALNGDKWCAWAHSSIDTNGRALAPVRANPRWGLGPKLIQIDREQWRGVEI